jgi:hypothetical protein
MQAFLGDVVAAGRVTVVALLAEAIDYLDPHKIDFMHTPGFLTRVVATVSTQQTPSS